jgi:hypothetical protein
VGRGWKGWRNFVSHKGKIVRCGTILLPKTTRKLEEQQQQQKKQTLLRATGN